MRGIAIGHGMCLLLAAIGCAHTAAHYQGPIVDTHVHVGITSVGQDDSPAAVERALIEGGIARAGIITMARKGHLPETRAQNDLVASLVRQHPERYFAFGSVHPDDGPEAAAELERLVTLGVRGLKLHPNTQQFDVASPAVDVVVKKATALKLVILFDSYSPFDANEIGKFVMLAMKNPEARIILAHMGGPQFLSMEVFAILKLYPSIKTNVWFDLSFVSHLVTGSPALSEQLPAGGDRARAVCLRLPAHHAQAGGGGGPGVGVHGGRGAADLPRQRRRSLRRAIAGVARIAQCAMSPERRLALRTSRVPLQRRPRELAPSARQSRAQSGLS
jgi:hypothetical protein